MREKPILNRYDSVVDLIDDVLLFAIQHQASDLHFHSQEEGVEVRYRIDGSVVLGGLVSSSLSSSLMTRIKVLSGMNVAESRLPQDGRMQIDRDDNHVDMRVSSLPTVCGESIVIRFLNKEMTDLDLENLGLSSENQIKIDELLHSSYGIVLATGPTGAGKTTTLYAMLKKMNKKSVKIITVEDPVEYDIDGVIQVPISLQSGLGFSRILRHILRQDPDIIVIGEIRDSDTLNIAVQASLTGHLVLSSLHTNDAVSTVSRLLNMGLEPYLINASLKAVIAQRLVRRLCSCHRFRKLDSFEKEHFSWLETMNEVTQVVGCEQCYQQGFIGRLGIYEVLVHDDEMKEQILSSFSQLKFRQLLLNKEFKFLEYDATLKIQKGQTTYEEVARELMFFDETSLLEL